MLGMEGVARKQAGHLGAGHVGAGNAEAGQVGVGHPCLACSEHWPGQARILLELTLTCFHIHMLICTRFGFPTNCCQTRPCAQLMEQQAMDTTGSKLDLYEMEANAERSDTLTDLAEFQLASVGAFAFPVWD